MLCAVWEACASVATTIAPCTNADAGADGGCCFLADCPCCYCCFGKDGCCANCDCCFFVVDVEVASEMMQRLRVVVVDRHWWPVATIAKLWQCARECRRSPTFLLVDRRNARVDIPFDLRCWRLDCAVVDDDLPQIVVVTTSILARHWPIFVVVDCFHCKRQCCASVARLC